MSTLYIAGPITGMPEHNFPAFHAAERLLVARGHTVLNPARHGADPNKTWHDYMRLGITDVLACDGIATLDSWYASRGARLEVHIAVSLDLPVLSIPEWAGGVPDWRSG